jgi:hypothetical protein
MDSNGFKAQVAKSLRSSRVVFAPTIPCSHLYSPISWGRRISSDDFPSELNLHLVRWFPWSHVGWYLYDMRIGWIIYIQSIYNLYTICIQSIYNLYTIYIQCTLHCIKGSDRHWLDGKLPNCRMVPQSLPWSMAPHPGNAGHGAPIRITSCWWVPHHSVIEHRPFIDDVWWFTFHTWWCYV